MNTQILKLNAQETSAWRRLRTHAAAIKAVDADLELKHALSLTSYEVLKHLNDAAEEHQMRMCDLAATVLLSRSGLTRLVDRLAKEGLLVRVACCDDARGSFAKLTPLGREKLVSAHKTYLVSVHKHLFSRTSEEELEALAY